MSNKIYGWLQSDDKIEYYQKQIDSNAGMVKLVSDMLNGSKYKVKNDLIETILNYETDVLAPAITSVNYVNEFNDMLSIYPKNKDRKFLQCLAIEYYCRNITSVEMLLDAYTILHTFNENKEKFAEWAYNNKINMLYTNSLSLYLEFLFNRIFGEYGHAPDADNTDMERLRYFNAELKDGIVDAVLYNIENFKPLSNITVAGLIDSSVTHNISAFGSYWLTINKLLVKASKQGFVFTNDLINCLFKIADFAKTLVECSVPTNLEDALDNIEEVYMPNDYEIFGSMLMAEIALSNMSFGTVVILESVLDGIVDSICDDARYEKVISKDVMTAINLYQELENIGEITGITDLIEMPDDEFIAILNKIKSVDCGFLFTTLRNILKPYRSDTDVTVKYVKRINSKNLTDAYNMAGLGFLNKNGNYNYLAKDLYLANLIYDYVKNGRISLVDTSAENIKRIDRFELNIRKALLNIRDINGKDKNNGFLVSYIKDMDIFIEDPNTSLCCEIISLWILNNIDVGSSVNTIKFLIMWAQSIDINLYMKIADKHNQDDLKLLLRLCNKVFIKLNIGEINNMTFMPSNYDNLDMTESSILIRFNMVMLCSKYDVDKIVDKHISKNVPKKTDDVGSPEDTVDISTYTPQAIVDVFDKYVVGQLDTKRALAVSMRNRWRRAQLPIKERAFINKNNVMIKGPTGCGKTALLKVLRLEFGLPIIEVDMSEYTASGYVGKSISDLPGLLLRYDCPTPDWYVKLIKAKGDSDKVNKRFKAEFGVIFLDEIDKLIVTEVNSGSLGTFKQEVQYNLLKIIEGGIYDSLDMSNVLFIAAGAFSKTKPTDFAPEFLGRFPIRTELKSLTKTDLIHLLKLESSPLKAAIKLISVEGITVISDEDTNEYIAEKVVELNKENNLGARNVVAIVENIFEDVYFDTTDLKDGVFNITGHVLRASD